MCLLICSLISGTNQDGFIQRALNASRAYTNIINSMQEAEAAAKKAFEASTEALEVQSTTLSSHISAPLLMRLHYSLNMNAYTNRLFNFLYNLEHKGQRFSPTSC